MKKFIALVCVFTMLCSIPVLAAGSVTTGAVVAEVKASAPTVVANAEGFTSAADVQQAESRGMSAVEFYNNAVATIAGVDSVVPVGQGGKILINGVATNLSATLSKVNAATVADSKAQATALGGELFNVMNVTFPAVNFTTATVNFYVKDLLAGTKVVVKQLVNGVWVDVEVTEIRADHVVLNLTSAGPLAFVKLP